MKKLTLVSLILLTGCQHVGPKTTFQKDSTVTDSTKNLFEIQDLGWRAASNRPINQLQMDSEGIYKQADGQFMDMGVLIPVFRGNQVVTVTRTTTDPDGTVTEEDVPVTVRLFSSDPTNSTLSGFNAIFNKDTFTINIAGVSHDNATVLLAMDKQVIASLEAEGIITKEQSTVAQAQLAAGVKLADILATFGTKFIVP